MRKKKLIWSLIFGTTLCLIIYHLFNYSIEASELREVTGILERELEFDTGSKNNRILVNLREDDVRYQTAGIGYDKFRIEEAYKYLCAGVVVTMLVDERNRFYSLKSGNYYYLRLESYNRELENRRWWLLVAWFFALGAVLCTMWLKSNGNPPIKR